MSVHDRIHGIMPESQRRLNLPEFDGANRVVILNPPMFPHEGRLSIGQAASCVLVDIFVRFNRLNAGDVVYSSRSYNAQGKPADAYSDPETTVEKLIAQIEQEKTYLGLETGEEGFLDYAPAARHSSQELFLSLWSNGVLERQGRRFYLSINKIGQKYDIENAINKVAFYPESVKHDFEQIYKDTLGETLELTKERNFATPLPLYFCENCDAVFPATMTVNVLREFDPRRISEECPECQTPCLNKKNECLSPLFDIASQAYFLQRKYGQSRTLMVSGRNVLARYPYQTFLVGMGLDGKSPFDEIVVHSFLDDDQGKRMSKANKNVIYIRDVVESNSEIHPDAIRYALFKSISLNANRSEFGRFLLGGGQKFVYKVGNLRKFFATNGHLLSGVQIDKRSLAPYIKFMGHYDFKSAFSWIEDYLGNLSRRIKNENDQKLIHDLDEESQIYANALWALKPFMPAIVEKSEKELGLVL